MSDKGSINNITLPVYKKLKKVIDNTKNELQEEIAEVAVEASKDIISQLAPVYNEETGKTRIVFPPNILPLRMYASEIDGEIFFDYDSKVILDDEEEEIGMIDFETINEENCVVLYFRTEFTSLTNAGLTYCLFNGFDNILNTYNLYYPQSGTKLYRHAITMTASGGNYRIDIIATTGVQITQWTGGPQRLNNIKWSDVVSYLNRGSNLIIPSIDAFNDEVAFTGIYTFSKENDVVTYTFTPFTSFVSDVVTPL